MNLLFWKKKAEPVRQEPLVIDRHAEDLALLQKYQAFDNTVGSFPTQETLKNRFSEAVVKGHTQVVADTLQKKLKDANEVTLKWPSVDEDETSYTLPSLVQATLNNHADMVQVLLPVASLKNLNAGLLQAEHLENASITKVIREEMTKRNSVLKAASF